jgi:hypothetical protein
VLALEKHWTWYRMFECSNGFWVSVEINECLDPLQVMLLPYSYLHAESDDPSYGYTHSP